ncbi:MAG: MarR family transcriptional regulator [Candidatus Omnitrophota bacterium]
MNKNNIQAFSEEVLGLMPYIFKGVLRQTDALAKGHITIPQFVTLNLITKKGSVHPVRNKSSEMPAAPAARISNGVKMKDIAKDFNISLPAATGIVQRLFNLELVKRVDDKADRRIVRIVVTPKGKKIVNQVSAKRKEFIGSIFSRLSEKERQDYLKILRKLKDIISSDIL